MKKLKSRKTVYILPAFLLVIALIGGGAYFYHGYEKTVYEQDETVTFDDFELTVDNVEANNLEFSELKDFYSKVDDGSENTRNCDLAEGDNDPRSQFAREFADDIARSDCEARNNRINSYLDSKNEISDYQDSNKRIDIWYGIRSKSNNLEIEDIEISIISPEENLQGKRFEHANFFEDEIHDRTRNEIEKGELTQDLKRSGVAWADIQKDTHEVDLRIEYEDSRKTVQIKLNEN